MTVEVAELLAPELLPLLLVELVNNVSTNLRQRAFRRWIAGLLELGDGVRAQEHLEGSSEHSGLVPDVDHPHAPPTG